MFELCCWYLSIGYRFFRLFELRCRHLSIGRFIFCLHNMCSRKLFNVHRCHCVNFVRFLSCGEMERP